jgi:hypothetical protein
MIQSMKGHITFFWRAFNSQNKSITRNVVIYIQEYKVLEEFYSQEEIH